MSQTFSLVTNAAASDAQRIRHTVPSWLRTFGARLSEVVIVVDPQAATGRIASLHGGRGNLQEVLDEIARLRRFDPRVRSLMLPSQVELEPIARRWFHHDVPMRCQSGTPIMAFITAFESASTPIVLRADCDMLFHERGWLDEGLAALESGEMLVEPPRLGTAWLPPADMVVSTRALLTLPAVLHRTFLPIRPHRLGLARALHRRLHGRPQWLALEQMLDLERRRGRLRHRILDDEALGFSLHVAARADADAAGFDRRVARVECDDLPARQRRSWNYLSEAWG
jgi:hypothetical protein